MSLLHTCAQSEQHQQCLAASARLSLSMVQSPGCICAGKEPTHSLYNGRDMLLLVHNRWQCPPGAILMSLGTFLLKILSQGPSGPVGTAMSWAGRRFHGLIKPEGCAHARACLLWRSLTAHDFEKQPLPDACNQHRSLAHYIQRC